MAEGTCLMYHRPRDFDDEFESGGALVAPAYSPTTEPVPVPARRRLGRSIALAALPVAALLGFALTRLGGPTEAAAMPPPQVTVAAPLQRSVVEYDEYTGRFEASRTVEVRPRVSGQLQSIHFRDGDIVRQGQLLFVIDPRPFAAALAEAQARAASARTAAALARSELARAERLIDDQAVSAEEVDNLRAAVRSADAAVAAAQATVRAKALDVEFTRVRAPISGRISDRRVDAGNLVAGGDAGSASLLTTIHALDPIHFSFDASESLYLKSRRESGANGQAEVQIRLQDESGYGWRGIVDFTDNGINPNSGTIRGRAVLRNPDYFLTPGMFGNMRLSGGKPVNALLVPESAVLTDQARRIVMVLDRDGKVAARPVELGPIVDGLRVIRSGITQKDRVIIRGFQKAPPGTPVVARVDRILPSPGIAARPAPSAPAASAGRFAAP
jgi:membrane fusion protein, multidrug efflux system